jgi:hypothetical protein
MLPRSRMLRSLLLTGVLPLLTAMPSPAQAHEPPSRRSWVPVRQSLVSVTLVDGRGESLPTALHRGRTFVAGERGERYGIRLTNNTRDRLEVVVSVDGRDVVSGERADFARHRGYVLEPHATLTIEGFRRSLSQVATFRFSDVPDSYASRRGNARDAGVIGVVAFRERTRAPREIARGGASDRAPRSDDFVEFEASRGPAKKSASPSARRPPSPSESTRSRQELGTEFGEGRRSEARRVSFERRSTGTPDFSASLFYDTAQALASRGVPVGPVFAVDPDPSPRPWSGRVGSDGFASPPPPRR